MKEMRDEMKRRDDQLREELRWRDNHQYEQSKKKGDELIVDL